MVNVHLEEYANTKGSFEYQCAKHLKEIVENYFTQDSKRKINGDISIFHNVQIPTQKIRDIDIVVIGVLDNYSVDIDLPKKFKKNKKTGNKKYHEKIQENIKVKNICFTIEVKKHKKFLIDGFEAIRVTMPGDKIHDVTAQSEKQKYSLKCYLENHLGKKNYVVYPSNIIWLPNLSIDNTQYLDAKKNSNILLYNLIANQFDFDDIININVMQNRGHDVENIRAKFSNPNFDPMLKVKEIINQKEIYGNLTREKLELITKKLIKDQDYGKNIGKKVTIISGKPGTGKTIKLLRLAIDLYKNHDKSVLLLTYNKMLVSDISRTLFLASDFGDYEKVSTKTIHKFFYDLMTGVDLKDFSFRNFITDYDTHLDNLYEYLKTKTLTVKDILNEEMKSNNQLISWDHIMIDEAQDCNEKERDILNLIFGKENIIISQSKSQLIRTVKPCNWKAGLLQNEYSQTNEKRGLRQKLNLANFVNQYAKKEKLHWSLDLPFKLPGGKVIITESDYFKKSNLHNSLIEKLKEDGNDEFDLLFLYGDNNYKKDANKIEKIRTNLKNLETPYWDGSLDPFHRGDIYPNKSQIRYVPYNVCRGLEGWIVVCHHLDDYLLSQYRKEKNTFVSQDLEINMFETEEEVFRRYIYNKAIIPFTRAIDTLVITLKNKDTRISTALKEIFDDNVDSIEWI
tara:strand:- start:679 stop:2718 length:2040 start_codon:yes stop_codon:yes gene_type:complete